MSPVACVLFRYIAATKDMTHHEIQLRCASAAAANGT